MLGWVPREGPAPPVPYDPRMRLMIPLRGLASAGWGFGVGDAASIGAAVIADVVAGSPFLFAPAGRRRRRRPRDGGLSAWPASVVATTGVGSTSITGFGATVAPDGRRRRLRDRVGAVSAVPAAERGTLMSLRRTLAPTSPSAHSVPSPLNTSTRQTTVPTVEAGKGGRF